MERSRISEMIYGAILTVSPMAAELLPRLNDDDIVLTALGVNSIDYAEIVSIVMDQLNIEYPLDIFASTLHIGELVDIFQQLLNRTSE